jgi:GNAT superfamily N-acetyltransferase
MLDYARPVPGEATDRALVTVVFLRMNTRPARPMAMPPAGVIVRKERLDLPTYRALYARIGAPYLWWLRRIMPDELLKRHLASPALAIHVMRIDGEIAGFFETDASSWPDVNLNYFGLVPEFIGRGLGSLLLDMAVDSVFNGSVGLRGMTVNTCTADHPRALPNYIKAGFTEFRRMPETWDIPRRLGLTVPSHLRG